MTLRRRIQCIRTANGRITHIGGNVAAGGKWIETVERAIANIRNSTWEFYVSSGVREIEVVVANNQGTYYLRTEADSSGKNNLLNLPTC